MAWREGGRAMARTSTGVFHKLAVLVIQAALTYSTLVTDPADQSYTLTEPVTDLEHSTACPEVGGICPFLLSPNPTQNLPPGVGGFNIRNRSELTATQISTGASTPFFLYDYKYVSNPVSHTYTVVSGTAQNQSVTVTIGYTFGRMYVVGASECGPDVFATDLTGSTAGLFSDFAGESPLRFSVTGTFAQVNCFLGKLFFIFKGEMLPNDPQFALNGGLPTIDVSAGNPPNIQNYRGIYKSRTIFTSNPVSSAPYAATCPTHAPVTTWTRPTSGTCLTPPALTMPNSEVQSCTSRSLPGLSGTYYACSKCGNSKSTVYYVSEKDTADAPFTGMFIEDHALYFGDVSMTFSMKFSITNGNTPLAQDDIPPRHLEAGPLNTTSTSTYCAEAKTSACVDEANGCLNTSKTCATATAPAYADVWIPSDSVPFTRYAFRVLQTPSRGVWCLKNSQDCGDCVGEDIAGTGAEYCPCKTGMCFARYTGNGMHGHSRVYVASLGGSPPNAQSFLFWEFYDVNAPSVTLQSGVIDMKLSQTAGTSWAATGVMYVRPQTVTVQGKPLNWYKVSPFTLEGTYDTSTEVLAFSRVETQSDIALKMNMTVTCAHCTLDLPLRGVEYSTGSTASSRKIHGNIRELNMALRKIVYTPAWAVGYNTQSVSTTARPVTPEELILVFDKTAINTAQSIPISNGVTSINAIVLPIVIVADNQPAFVTSPHKVGQPGYTAFNLSENTQRQILNTVVADPDLDELLVTQFPPYWTADSDWLSKHGASTEPQMPATTCPGTDGKQIVNNARMTVFVNHGSIFFNWTDPLIFREITIKDAEGTIRRIEFPSKSLVRRLGMKPGGDVRCGLDDLLSCTKVGALEFTPAQPVDRVVWMGIRSVTVEGTQPCFNKMVQDVMYKTDEDYNNNVPDSGAPVDIIGCARDTTVVPSFEALQFSVDDLGHKGCIAPTVSSIGTGSVPIIVTGVTSKLAIKAPGALYVLEDSVLAFTNNGCPPTKARSCSALQIITRDAGDLALLTRNFRLELTVKYGGLTVGNLNGATAVEGGGGAAKKLILSGKLCSINRALMTTSYKPDANFNSEARVWDAATSTWGTRSEELSVLASQDSGLSTVGTYKITVAAVNDPPAVTIVSGGTGSEIATPYSDIFMCGGDVACDCPAGALACVRVEDPDSCEAKAIESKQCADDSTSSGNVRFVVHTGTTNAFFFDSEDLGCTSSACGPASRGELLSAARASAALSGAPVGNNVKNLEVLRPIEQIQRGVLRIYASQEIFGPESITIYMVDQGSSGGAVKRSASTTLSFTVTACQKHTGWSCKGGAVPSGAPASVNLIDGDIPGYGLILVAMVFIGIAAAIWYGATRFLAAGAGGGGWDGEDLDLDSIEQVMGDHIDKRVNNSSRRFTGEQIPGSLWKTAVDASGDMYWYHRKKRITTYIDPFRDDATELPGVEMPSRMAKSDAKGDGVTPHPIPGGPHLANGKAFAPEGVIAQGGKGKGKLSVRAESEANAALVQDKSREHATPQDTPPQPGSGGALEEFGVPPAPGSGPRSSTVPVSLEGITVQDGNEAASPPGSRGMTLASAKSILSGGGGGQAAAGGANLTSMLVRSSTYMKSRGRSANSGSKKQAEEEDEEGIEYLHAL